MLAIFTISLRKAPLGFDENKTKKESYLQHKIRVNLKTLFFKLPFSPLFAKSGFR